MTLKQIPKTSYKILNSFKLSTLIWVTIFSSNRLSTKTLNYLNFLFTGKNLRVSFGNLNLHLNNEILI